MWERVGPDRWRYPDPDGSRHLLLYDNSGTLAELHGAWIHWYRTAETGPGEDPWPLTGAAAYRTVETAQEPPTDEAGWQVLADALQEA